jgi:hypothetical protein
MADSALQIFEMALSTIEREARGDKPAWAYVPTTLYDEIVPHPIEDGLNKVCGVAVFPNQWTGDDIMFFWENGA